MYDVAVIGGGPGGYTAAVKAAQLGFKTVLFEMDRVGGVCLNQGCIPTKALLKSAEVLATARNAAAYGVAVPECHLDFSRVMQRKNDVVAQLTKGVAFLLKSNGVELVREKAAILSNSQIEAGGKVYECKNVIIATGSKPVLPPIDGIDSPSVVTSNELLDIPALPESLVIVGGGVIGVEFAFAFSEFGCSVTILEMMDSLLAMADKDVYSFMTKQLQKRNVTVLCGSKLTHIGESGVTYTREGKEFRVECDRVLVATGRIPSLSADALDSAGIRHDRGRIITDEHMRTNVDGVYAIGDANGKWMLAHTASTEAGVAVNHIAGIPAIMRYDQIPQCVYAFPEAAWIGLTEKQARESGRAVKCSRFSMRGNGKSLVQGNTDGFIKFISDARTGEVVGAHLVCEHATDLICEVSLGMRAEACIEDFAEAIHAHPTIAEAIMEAAQQNVSGQA